MKKKVHISLLIIPCLNLTSLHSRPAAPTIPTSTPQTSTQSASPQPTSTPPTSTHSTQLRKPHLNSANLNSTPQTSTPATSTQQTSTPPTSTPHTSTPSTSTQLRKPQLNQPQLNSANLSSSNLDSTNFNLLAISLHSTSVSRLRYLDNPLYFGRLWHTATTTRRPSSLSSLSRRHDTTFSSGSAILPFHYQLFTELSTQLHSFFITVLRCLPLQNVALRSRFPDDFTQNPLAPTNFFSKGRALYTLRTNIPF